MAARSRFLPDHRNHDKKDGVASSRSHTQSFFGPWKSFRRRRIILGLLAIWLLYLFFKNMPTDVPPISERFDRRYGRLHPGLPGDQNRLSQRPGNEGGDSNYEGPIAFYGLGKTLRGKATTRDAKGNVLFAVSRLESIPHILPMACSMAQHNRNRVHVAFMGGQAARWPDITAMNGVSEDDCNVFLHDARPDFATQSSSARMDISARASLGHMHAALQLRAVLVGDGYYEDGYFVNALREKSASMGLSLVALAADSVASLSWISSLDAAALQHFSKIHIDIVIQAQPESSASVIRLLRSLKDADYGPWPVPRLTVELPPRVDPFLTEYLARFQWPPDVMGGESKLVIRRRIDTTLLSPVQASMRTIESFYPQTPGESHVLLLSPSVELSPGYFQLLMYTLLEYRYAARRTDLVNHMVGFSLDLPTYAPDRKTESPWTTSRLDYPLLLWQSPSPNAALYFGDRWLELRSFLARRLFVDADLVKTTAMSPSMSRDYPAWLQTILEMMQARGYYMLYPTFAIQAHSAPVTVHQELHQPPEEFINGIESDAQSPDDLARADLSEDVTLTADEEVRRLMREESRTYAKSLVTPLLESMTLKQRMENMANGKIIPLMSYDGQQIEWQESGARASKFAQDFAQTIGGCASYDPNRGENGRVESFFCLPAG